MEDSSRVKLFISYSHVDKSLCDQFEKHLSPLKDAGVIDHWIDKELKAGDEWDEEIKRNLRIADIVIFLLSPDMLASEYVKKIEMQTAFNSKVSGQLVVPIMLRECKYKFTRFKDLQGLPKPFEPIDNRDVWRSNDRFWSEVTDGLELLLTEVQNKKRNQNKQKAKPQEQPIITERKNYGQQERKTSEKATWSEATPSPSKKSDNSSTKALIIFSAFTIIGIIAIAQGDGSLGIWLSTIFFGAFTLLCIYIYANRH